MRKSNSQPSRQWKMCPTSQAPTPCLLGMPHELITHILKRLEPSSWKQFGSVHPKLRHIIQDACKSIYGPVPFHRVPTIDHVSGKQNFRALAQEEAEFERPIDCSPEAQLQRLLDDEYCLSNDFLAETGCEILLVLRRTRQSFRSNTWHEAVATALMAQGRFEEAREHYYKLAEGETGLPEQTNLTAARWKWPFESISLPQITSAELLPRASIGASLGGSTLMLKSFFSKGVSPTIVVNRESLASAAAVTGQIQILKLLGEEKGVDLDASPPGGNSPLWTATNNGQLATAEFLLDWGARPIIPDGRTPFDRSPFDRAMRGKADMLRLFLPYMPKTWTAVTSLGNLRIEPAVRDGRIDVIECLVHDFNININEVDKWGRSVLHLAAKYDNEKVAAVVIALGVNMEVVDDAGQTAFEYAASYSRGVADLLAREVGNSASQLKNDKPRLVRGTLEFLHHQVFLEGDSAC